MTTSNHGNDRRDFLKQSVFGTTAAGMVIASTTHVAAQSVTNAAKPEVTNDVDVLVVGGGTAGHVAAPSCQFISRSLDNNTSH